MRFTLTDLGDWDEDGRSALPPGSGQWVNGHRSGAVAALDFVCPCGCGKVRSVDVAIGGNKRHHVWNWNGDRERPTLSPSLDCLTGCRWHGWLTDGQFRSA